MNSYTININTPVSEYRTLTISGITYADDSIILTTINNSHMAIDKGQSVFIFREIEKENGIIETLKTELEVLDIINNDIKITPINNEKFIIKYIEEIDEENFRIYLYKNHNIFQQDLDYSNNQELYFYNANQELIKSATTENFSIPLRYENKTTTLEDCLIKKDIIDKCGDIECSGCSYIFKYYLLPDKVSRNSILISGIELDEIVDAKYISFKNSPFYFQSGDTIFTYEDRWLEEGEINQCDIIENAKCETKICVYDGYYKLNVGISSDSDELSLGNEDSFNNTFIEQLSEELIPLTIDMERVKYSPAYENFRGDERYFVWYSPNGYEKCHFTDKIYTKEIFIDEGIIENNKVYYNNNGTISSDTGCERYVLTYEYGPWFEGGVMPTLYRVYRDNSGTERDCKYYLSNEIEESGFFNITGITFYLHFRERKKIPANERESSNSTYTSGNVYYDTWHIDEDKGDYTWWNGYNIDNILEKEKFNQEAFSKFNSEMGKKSDLIGYLNFTDNDIFYRKKKVSKSFLRLLFYTSKDPINQKLLYYSTIFLDDGELYGKYLKQLQYLRKTEYYDVNMRSNSSEINKNALVVLYNGGENRVDSKITVTNEYDKSKSSEGFNLYLFAEDKNFNFENGEKTIYMRVEFNHAGNGKTTPLIIWPKDNSNNFVPLTTENYIDSLYIPVKLMCINKDGKGGKYVYIIEGGDIVNNNLELVLYEPKLDMLNESYSATPNSVNLIYARPQEIVFNKKIKSANTITVKSNTNWTFDNIPNDTKLKYKSDNSDVDKTTIFSSGDTIFYIDEIPTGRTSQFYVRTVSGSVAFDKVTITKAKAEKPYLKLSVNDLYYSGETIVNVISNADWEIEEQTTGINCSKIENKSSLKVIMTGDVTSGICVVKTIENEDFSEVLKQELKIVKNTD